MGQQQMGKRLAASGIPHRAAPGRTLVLAAALFLFALIALAACGSSSGYNSGPGITPTAHATSTPVVGGTSTPGPAAYAYLYSRIDYPLQVPVNASDLVTLTLSPQSNILTVTPGPGSGTGSLTNPIPLPTDLQNYQDIGASVATSAPASGAGPLAWALVSPPRQTLLSPASAGTRAYLDAVTFRWSVTAAAAGQNVINITLYLYYVYLDGSEHDGAIQVSQAPIPIVAAASTPLNTSLPPFRLPLAGLTSLAGIFAVVRFIMGAIRTYHDITDPVKDVATVAQTIRTRAAGGGSGSPGDGGASTPDRGSAAGAPYPNPWSQPPAPPPASPPPQGGQQFGAPVNPPPQNGPSANRPWPPRPQ